MGVAPNPVGGLNAAPLPEPTGWTGQRLSAVFKFSMVYLAVMALGAAALAVWAFASGDPAAGILLAAGAVYLAHVVGFVVSVRWTPRRRHRTGTLATTPDGERGVRFGYSAWPYYWLAAMLVLTELILLIVVAVAVATATVAGAVTAAVVAALFLALGWFLVTMLRLAPGTVTLTPTGVYHRSLTFTLFLPWRDIAAILTGWLGTPVLVAEAADSAQARIRRYTGRFGARELRYLPSMMVRTYWLAADPATVYHALAFYHGHRELLRELGTPEGLQRIAAGRAVAPF